jgi:ubiquinone/menaquinone biosynthesis C-methylase UbiE
METIEKPRLTHTSAEIYDAHLVPSLFQQWTDKLVDAAALERGARVVDVACGTGVLTRAVADAVGRDDWVAGVDCSEPMLEVARRRAPCIDWRLAHAECLPFGDESFDAVVSQFGLMFFQDKVAALREMLRVVRPGGRIALAVWDRSEHAPGFAVLIDMLERICGPAAANELRTPFSLGEKRELHTLCVQAGMRHVSIQTHEGTARFASIRGWMDINIRAWTLGAMIDDRRFRTIVQHADDELAAFADDTGAVSFPIRAHLVVAAKH